ncbi:MAG: hypothetical protein LBU22_06885 [Dysgonamonadaceae bacterium]|jgi:hypothetical protein|nr:hypothetical protein [Dysgonamonadaceae bacterium]
METSKVASLAKRVEALAAGFIGVCFFSIGTSYFQERFIYRIPRILSPVFDLFGNVGAALGMLIIGIGFLVWAFLRGNQENRPTRFKKRQSDKVFRRF